MALAAAMITALLSAALLAALASFSATVASYAVRARAARDLVLDPARRAGRPAGPVGLGQDHAAVHHRRAGPADQRPGRGGGPGRHEAERRRPGPDAVRDGGVHLP